MNKTLNQRFLCDSQTQVRAAFLFILLFLCIQEHSAQTITQVFHEPVVGEVDKNYRLDTSAYTGGLPTSITGSNVVWDFSQMKGAFPVMFDSIIAPSAAPGASLFPGATFVQNRSGIYSYFRSASGPDMTELVGAYSPSLTLTFSNSAVIASYPISYGYSMLDYVSGNFQYGNTTGACNGSIAVAADGLGTVNFPNGVTFQNVLRLKSVEELTVSVNFAPIGKIRQSIYSYYAPGEKYPIINIQYQEYHLLVGTPTITAYAYGNFDYFTVAGIAGQEVSAEAPEVFPNPFREKLFLKEGSEAIPRQYVFYDLHGRKLMQNSSLGDLPLEGLAPGIYILEIRSRDRSVFQKLIRE